MKLSLSLVAAEELRGLSDRLEEGSLELLEDAAELKRIYMQFESGLGPHANTFDCLFEETALYCATYVSDLHELSRHLVLLAQAIDEYLGAGTGNHGVYDPPVKKRPFRR